MSRRINRDDIDKFHDYSLHIPSRTIYMGSERVDDGEESGVDATMAERQLKNILILESLSNDPITIVVNNPGGDVNHGMAIYDAIKNCKSHVTIKVFGMAMSMGSIVLQAGDERVMAPNASQMIHYGTESISGHSKTVEKIREENKRVNKWMEDVYLEKIRQKHPKFTRQRLQRLLDHDTFLTAEESIKLGLADKILGEEE